MPAVHETIPDGHTIWRDLEIFPELSDDIFSAEYWQHKNALTGQAQGRGTTYFFKHHGQQFVLRHYKRGGMVGKLLNDQYFYTGLVKTRAWQELHLLQHLNELGLPVPKPAAARVCKNSIYYTADIITAKIPNAQDCHMLLTQGSLSQNTWKEIGKAIALLHHFQVYHHDLNIHNIMIDDKQKIWLIDFDKCGIKKGEHWKADNLSRLKRSLVKESEKQPNYHYQPTDWQSLIDGYQQS